MTYTDEIIHILSVITTRDETGRHFTKVFPEWEKLEEAGLIDVYRPIHTRTGMPYSREYWHVHLTDKGLDLVQQDVEEKCRMFEERK